MSARRWALLLLGGAALAAACRSEPPAPAPSPAATPSSSAAVRPLTSRDESKPFETPSAAPDALPPGHPPIDGKTGAAATPAKPGASLSGTITVAAPLQARAAAAKVLYVIARNRASKSVVAVRRVESPQFPHAFELSSADAMTPDQPFTGPFDVTARLSKTGDAIPAPGDLEGTARNVAEGARAVSIVIETVRQ